MKLCIFFEILKKLFFICIVRLSTEKMHILVFNIQTNLKILHVEIKVIYFV